MQDPPKKRGFRTTLADLWRRLRRRDPGPPADPYAYKFAPVRRGPKGRSGAAVAEPEEEQHSFFLSGNHND